MKLLSGSSYISCASSVGDKASIDVIIQTWCLGFLCCFLF